MRVYYFRYYWPSKLVFVITCVINVPNLRKIGQKLRSLSCTNDNADRQSFQTDIHSSDFISIQRHALYSTDDDDNDNKFAQSNLGRGPRRGTVAHVRRKVHIGYNGVPQIRLQKYLSRGPIPTPHYLPHPWTRPTYDAKRHPDPIRRFSTMHWTAQRTDAPTHRPTDRPRESLIAIGRCAPRATRLIIINVII